MAEPERQPTAPDAAPAVALEGGTYEILRNRLTAHGKELRQRLGQLNEARKQVFGSIETALIATERVTTAHNCVPRDLVAVGSRLLFGYNVHFGLKSERNLEDVFAAYEFRDRTFHELPLDLVRDERFEKNFQDVYRYYKNAVFAKFLHIGPYLYMVFHVGKGVDDFKAFKWAPQGDRLTYVDNRSDHEVRYPPQHGFEWVRTTRDMHKSGAHPHVSIADRVFVETVGGDLTIKIENNTESGEGIYSEPVANKDQTLDDAEIFYALLDNIILLKIRPYQEQQFRHILYNEKTQQAMRLDAIAHACVLLPDDHGLIFPNGYYLQTGESKTFDNVPADMTFERRVAAPNGEDYLYVFYNREQGLYVLLQYNVIGQRVETPIVCHGFTRFEAGELICFKAQDAPQKHHALQIWQTPFTGENYVPPVQNDSYLFKIGNRDIVRGMAECHAILSLIDKEDTYAGLYVDLVKLSTDVIDSYFWIDRPEASRLKEPLSEIRGAAKAAIDEFEKVVRVRQNTAAEMQRVRQRVEEILAAAKHKRFEHIDDFVRSLADLRAVRGEVIGLRELRYVDAELVDALEQQVAEESDRLARRCVDFLLQPQALAPYAQKVDEAQGKIDGLQKVTEAKQAEEQTEAAAGELELLIEIVSNLKIDDATQRTRIIDGISAVFSTLNQARAALRRKKKELMSVEGAAEFQSQVKLLGQAVVNYLDVCDTPEKCDEFLTKLMIQVEELEGRFAEFDEFVVQLSAKREEIYSAFESRKVALVEARNKRAGALAAAADRILKGIKHRVEGLKSVNEIHGYFAADLMIEKVRDLVRQLDELGDTVKVDDIQSRMKTIREDTVRQLKDRQELFVGGENVIKFGTHLFNVNTQPLDLTTVLRDGRMVLHLTGTSFFEEIDDPRLTQSRDVWDQDVVSENRDVYRAEYLAWQLFQSLKRRPGQNGNGAPTVEGVRTSSQPELQESVQKFMAPRYSEGYVKGVHDHDAALILHALAEMASSVGLLRHSARCRALAVLFWQHFGDADHKAHMAARLRGFGTITRLFPETAAQAEYVAELEAMLRGFLADQPLFPEALAGEAARYLFDELTQSSQLAPRVDRPLAERVDHTGFAVSRTAADLVDAFRQHLARHEFEKQFTESVEAVRHDAADAFLLVRDWVEAFLETRGETDVAEYTDEVAVLLLGGRDEASRIVDAQVVRELDGLSGTHPVIDGGKYRLHFNRFMEKLERYAGDVVPRYREFVEAKKQIVEQTREAMRLEEFRPRVLTSFVRNRLLDTVYLPLIGDNLAKQIGTAGESKRTDRMGMLLLISPPGYGKTTLMEYIANRLGVVFMKINGPAIGHRVTSLDPAEAPNAAAREEMHKLGLALEMGDNVMLYLDDIQHCHPEFLQKFISLCDAQRKIEGVYKGKTRTYDFRGRKVAVVMAGNPYTESGEKFQIPDMLANRADVYNLGEIIGDHAAAFEMSFLENCLTSNPTLNKLASRSQKDVYAVIRMAERGGETTGPLGSGGAAVPELEGNYALEELSEMVAVMQKLMRVRDVILKVNREYIRSAAMADEYRTEPPFKLQGSYRNMNRIAEKVAAVMNDAELQSLLVSSYENDAQTLTTGAEPNLLKFKELLGLLTPPETQRWDDIRKTYRQNVKLRGIGSDDKFGQAILQLGTLGEELDGIRDAMTQGVQRLTERNGHDDADRLLEHLHGVRAGLETIGHALAERLQVPETPAAPPPSDLAAGLKELAAELRSIATAAGNGASHSGVRVQPSDAGDDEESSAGPGVPSQITVVNKLPRSMMNVLEQQFQLMQAWLKPLLSAANAQTAEMQELRQHVEACLHDYERLVGRLDAARNHPPS